MRESRTPSTFLVQPLDVSRLTDEAKASLIAGQPHRVTEAHTIDLGPKWGLVTTPTKRFLICTEGVGYDLSEEPAVLDIYATTEGHIAIMPVAQAHVTDHEVDAYFTPSGEPVPLHEWIRSFGARLENNYAIWERAIAQAQAPASALG